MVAPDVQIEDGKGTILISSEEGETEGKEDVYATVWLCLEGMVTKGSVVISGFFSQNFTLKYTT